MGAPKALLEFHGETFIERLIRILGVVSDPVIVAVGHHSAAIQARVKSPVRWAVNPDPDRGQLSSLQVALRLVPDDAEGFLFIPVDCPVVRSSTVERVARAFWERAARDGHRGPLSPDQRERLPHVLVIPRRGDHRGHPVCAAMPVRDELLSLPPTGQAREVVHRHIAETLYVDVDDAGILSDIDDPEAYRRLLETAG